MEFRSNEGETIIVNFLIVSLFLMKEICAIFVVIYVYMSKK